MFCFPAQPLDFEARSEYSLKLRVENVNALSSKAQNPPVSTAAVRVTVVNQNEAPHFSEDPVLIVVPESVPPGTLLKSNYVSDPDNSELRYEAAAKGGGFDGWQTAGVTFNLPAGLRSAEILRGGWTSTELQETLLQKEAST